MFLNINFNATYPSNALSNQTPHPFNFEDFQNIPCMESFLQSLKFEDPEEQTKILYLSAEDAIAAGKCKAWDTYLFWKGQKINRFSKEYMELMTRAYRSLFLNVDFREALLASGHKILLHTSGKTFRKNTVLTWWEFVCILTKLRKEAAQIDFAEDTSKSESAQSESTQNESEELVPQQKTTEEIFVREWTPILAEHARVFNGLFNGLRRVKTGSAKKPEKVLREWCQRTHYKWENEPVDMLCQEHIASLITDGDRENLTKWACLLMDAAVAAGVTMEEGEILILTEENADAYVEWDGNELYPEDEIEIITPAWYQNGKVLEQGQCRKYAPFSAWSTYGNHMYRRPGERADVIFTTKTGEKKIIVDNDGRIMDFPGIKKEDFWMKEIQVKKFLDPVICFWTRFAKYDNERYIMYWQVQPDGRYWEDEDGFGMEPDEEITLYAFIDQEGNFMGPFEIYQIGWKKYLE